MTHWMIELEGERFDIRELLSLNSSSDINITEENGRFYLRADEFDSYSEARDVLNRGIEILRVINGIAQLEITNWENVEVRGLAHDEVNSTRTQFLFPDPIRGRSRVGANFTITKSDSTIESSSMKSTFEAFFEISKKDSNVEKALRIFGSREHSWSNLYNIYGFAHKVENFKHFMFSLLLSPLFRHHYFQKGLSLCSKTQN